jgi:hypothetical protein
MVITLGKHNSPESNTGYIQGIQPDGAEIEASISVVDVKINLSRVKVIIEWHN